MAAPSRSIRGPGTRSGSSSGVAVQIVGLAELRKALRQLENPRVWSKALSSIHRDVAKAVAETARSYARAHGGSRQHFAAAIRGYGSVQAARVGINNPNAFAAYWGAKQDHTGWNAGNKGRPNQAPWIGASWDAAVRGQGPYDINDAAADRLPWIEQTVWTEVDGLTKAAFPTAA
jgi:hypothetical protein